MMIIIICFFACAGITTFKNMIVVADNKNRRLQLFDAQTFKHQRNIPTVNPPYSLCSLPKHNCIICATTKNTIEIYDANTCEMIDTFYFSDVSATRGGVYITAAADETIYISSSGLAGQLMACRLDGTRSETITLQPVLG